ncbi:hypothetical protein GEMRC1_010223 [Eukaryota sp. GEM-RC1]
MFISHNAPPFKKDRSSEDLLGIRPEADNLIDSFPNDIVLQESLLVSINLHVLRRLCASEFEKGVSYSFQQSFDRVNRMSEFLQNIGYVSNLFFQTACSAIQVFLGTHLFTVRWPENLSKLATFASFFNSELHSIDLEVRDQFHSQDLVPFTSIIHNIKLSSELSHSNDFFDPQSPLFLPNLRQLSLGRQDLSPSNLSFDDVTAKFILESPTIEALDILLCFSTQAHLLTKIFSSSKCRLRKLIFNPSMSQGFDDHLLAPMFAALADCNSIQEVRVTRCHSFEVLAPLFSSSSIKRLCVSGARREISSIFDPLKYNSSLQELVMCYPAFNPNDIADVLKHNTVLKRLELALTDLSISPIFKSLESNSSLKELIVRDYCNRKTFESEEFEALCKMMRINKSLLILNFPGHLMTSTLFQLFVQSFKNNHVIKKVILPDTCSFKSLSSFVSDCETLCTDHLPSSIDFDPHFIDVQKGLFRFAPSSDGHCYIRISADEVSSLQSFVDRFSIKELTIKNCFFLKNQSMNWDIY